MEIEAVIRFEDCFWFCASGKSFFAGLGVLLLMVAIQPALRNRYWIISWFGILIGFLLVFLSATPLPKVVYCLFVIGYVGGYVLATKQDRQRIRNRNLIRVCMGILCGGLVVWESFYWKTPSILMQGVERICVIGDSVSSGLGGPKEQNWPKLLAQRIGIPVVNLAIAGETSESANRKQVTKVENGPCLVIIEIGGNDILNSVRPEQFEQNMRRMIQNLQPRVKRIVWFELPLIPTKGDYGRVQRGLSKEMGIDLIPKRYIASVFQALDATSDTIHLTSEGHARMADMVADLIGK